MSYTIFFDESNKLDKEKKYSYYGAFGCDSGKLLELNEGVEKIFKHFGKKQEFHFTEYKNDRNINTAFCFLNFFISLNFQVNIIIINNDRALEMAETRGLTTKDLRKLFYVKIPERLFYGLIREDDFDYTKVNIYLDHSPEYGSMRVYSKIKEQMNAHSLYRQLNYQIKQVSSQNSHDTYSIQMIDMMIGIIVYLIEKSYLNVSNKNIVKSDLIYRFLIEQNNLIKFQDLVNIYKWDAGGSESIYKIHMSEYLSEFMMHKSRFDIKEMKKIIELTTAHSQRNMQDLRKNLNYSNNMLQLLYGYLKEIEDGERNQNIIETYNSIFKQNNY